MSGERSFGQRGQRVHTPSIQAVRVKDVGSPLDSDGSPSIAKIVLKSIVGSWPRVIGLSIIGLFVAMIALVKISDALKTPEQRAADDARFAERVAQIRAERSAAESQNAIANAPKPPLRVDSFRCEREYGFMSISGKVKNTSDRPIDNLMIVGLFSQSDGTFIKSSSAMVEYQPLLPGQSSPFKTMTTHNPSATKCEAEFKTMFGGTVPYQR